MAGSQHPNCWMTEMMVMMEVLVERMLLLWFTLRRIIMSNRLNEAFFASFQRTVGPS